MSGVATQQTAVDKTNLALGARCALAGVKSLREVLKKDDTAATSKNYTHQYLFIGADKHCTDNTDCCGAQFEAVSDIYGDLVTEVVYKSDLVGEDAATEVEHRSRNLLAVAGKGD